MKNTEMDQALNRGLAAAECAADHANAVTPSWKEQALAFLARFAAANRDFMAEDVRAAAEADGLPAPPDGRAWGAVLQAGRKAGIICSIGADRAKSSNGSFKVRWKAA